MPEVKLLPPLLSEPVLWLVRAPELLPVFPDQLELWLAPPPELRDGLLEPELRLPPELELWVDEEWEE